MRKYSFWSREETRTLIKAVEEYKERRKTENICVTEIVDEIAPKIKRPYLSIRNKFDRILYNITTGFTK